MRRLLLPWRDEWGTFARTPLRVRVYVAALAVAAAALPLALPVAGVSARPLLTALCLVAVSVLNVEIGRLLVGGRSETQQPHKLLSVWAFACALLLSTPWLLLVVPLTYAHVRWRGLRVPLWKWVGSAILVLLSAYGAAVVRAAILGPSSWMDGRGGTGVLAMLLAAAVFLALQTAMFFGFAYLNVPEDEQWLRTTLHGSSFYLTETGVLLMGGLLAAVWTGGAWFCVLFVPIYLLAQRAALLEPLRERAELAAQLAVKNEELERSNRFKVDLIGMLGHELSNPLTSVQGYATLGADAVRRENAGVAAAAFEAVSRNATTLRAVLGDIVSLVTSDALVAAPEPCELAPRLAGIVEALPTDHPPRLECPAGLRALVQPGHLDQILANLLSNADKYGGGATDLLVRPVQPGRLEVVVVDAGPGVPTAFHDSLFDRLSRDDHTSEQVSGAGLGLFISRQLARANGGDLLHRDGTEGGSEFVVVLPVA